MINIKVGLAAPRCQPSPHEKSSDQTWSMSFQNYSSIFMERLQPGQLGI